MEIKGRIDWFGCGLRSEACGLFLSKGHKEGMFITRGALVSHAINDLGEQLFLTWVLQGLHEKQLRGIGNAKKEAVLFVEMGHFKSDL